MESSIWPKTSCFFTMLKALNDNQREGMLRSSRAITQKRSDKELKRKQPMKLWSLERKGTERAWTRMVGWLKPRCSSRRLTVRSEAKVWKRNGELFGQQKSVGMNKNASSPLLILSNASINLQNRDYLPAPNTSMRATVEINLATIFFARDHTSLKPENEY